MFHTAVKIHSKYERMRVNHEFYSIGGGGGTPIHKLYGDVPPSRVWFFDCPLINRVQIQQFSKIFYKQGLKITHCDE